MNVLRRCFFAIIFTQSMCSAFAQDSLSLLNQKILILHNWQVFLKQNYNSLPGITPDLVLEKSLAVHDSLTQFSGVCWFRKEFIPDQSFKNTPATLAFDITGAAEIYLNGKLIKRIGTVGFSEESEYRIQNDNEYLTIYFEPGKNYELLIRYSNHLKGHDDLIGFTASVHPANRFFESLISGLTGSIGLGAVLFSFFACLFFLHLLIYLFNRSEVSNLYYSVFCLSLAWMMFAFFSNNFIIAHGTKQLANLVSAISPFILFTIMSYMFRSFFLMKFPRWYWLFPVAGLIGLITVVFGLNLAPPVLLLLIIAGSFESFRVLIIAFRQKKPGVNIIGAGAIFFLLLIITFLCLITYSAFNGGNMHIESNIVLVFMIFSIISIPISITIFLAYRISITNRSLAQKLTEVELLSQQTIEQEKEKQHILENQKAILESQVQERTLQISEQKKIIEEKNKDIIDSITYAKRIQTAMLPDEKLFSAVFGEAFVLYEPRDIVSGDFYYAAVTAGGKLIIAADCTGHGVPGALMSMVGSNIINKLVHENKLSDPKTILESLHKELRHALKQDVEGSMNRDGMDICAVLIEESVIKYAGANRPLIGFDKNNVMFEKKATKTPVGGSHIEHINLELHTLNSENVSSIFIFSDGFADQFGGPEGKKLMVSRFKNWLQEIASFRPQDQKEVLSRKFSEWKQNTEQVDDVMLIGIKINPR